MVVVRRGVPGNGNSILCSTFGAVCQKLDVKLRIIMTKETGCKEGSKWSSNQVVIAQWLAPRLFRI